MPQEQTKDLCKLTRDKLSEASQLLVDFLDHIHLPKLIEESEQGENQERFLKEFLSDLRRLSVTCEQGYEKVSLVLRRVKFNEDFAEKVLNEIVRTCIYNFYYPKNEVYEEDGRYSYTNRDTIQFREEPPPSLKAITLNLSKLFEVLRDELEYYEMDYITRARMKVGTS
ncbi:Protein of unknown function [Marininema mesophilum]|uniref:DUF3907 domain-containing protein n=1 Tax=Marininema mesophilum TaxID=1048340 RepID=A0A1H3C9W0_9BACL|nr:DUF3907 family protein [Marininema mesophilum]SDX50972.1 Protein of unknown function [Marininema mesophilum]